MLSDTSTPVIEATLPVVGANINEIAQRFYRHLFQTHPELLDGIFNRGNQANGHQQQALAGSVAAFATMLVNNPGQLPESLLSRISHKHVSLGIKPEQYQIVHDHLFWAIADVLGEAVTPEVAAAWEEVFWLMANTLINLERGLYGAVDLSPDNVWRSWRLAQRIQETDDVVTFVVERTDARDVQPSLPGQYVTLQMPMPDGTHQPRQYSLTRADDGHRRCFAVKRITGAGSPDGEVSTLLHTAAKIGDEVILSAPFGDVVLDTTDRPVILASAGIGVAPMAGILSHLAQSCSSRQIMFLHAGTSPDTFALRNQVQEDLATLPQAGMVTWYEQGPDSGPGSGDERAGFMDLTDIELPTNAIYYLCGPLPFMQSVRLQLLDLGVSPRDIQYEVFGPDLWQADYE